MSSEATVRPTAPALAAPRVWPRAAGLATDTDRWIVLGLLVLDTLALVVAVALAYLIRFKAGVPGLDTPPHDLAFYSSVAFWAVPAWLGLFALYRLYDPRYLFSGFQEYTRIFHAGTTGL